MTERVNERAAAKTSPVQCPPAAPPTQSTNEVYSVAANNNNKSIIIVTQCIVKQTAMYGGMQGLCRCECERVLVGEATEQSDTRQPIPLYFVSSTENLTSFFGEVVPDPGPTSRDGRLCDDGIILVILEKRRGAKNELWRSV